MTCRIWRGLDEPGRCFRLHHMMLRHADNEAEFATVRWFDELNSVRRFVGEDYEVSHVAAAARAILSRSGDCAVHYQLFERRAQERAS